ncbi:hypothetical protein [Streptomyces rubiginosohelvolus]
MFRGHRYEPDLLASVKVLEQLWQVKVRERSVNGTGASWALRLVRAEPQ